MSDYASRHAASCFRSEDPDEECSCGVINDEISDLRAECARLREALERVREEHRHMASTWIPPDIARKAAEDGQLATLNAAAKVFDSMGLERAASVLRTMHAAALGSAPAKEPAPPAAGRYDNGGPYGEPGGLIKALAGFDHEADKQRFLREELPLAPAKEPTTNPVDAGSSVGSSPAKADEPKPLLCLNWRCLLPKGHAGDCKP